MNNWKALTITNEKYKRIMLITFLVVLYLIQYEPISQLMYLMEDVFENYSENSHVSFTSGIFHTFKVYEAEEFMTFVYGAIISVVYLAAPLLGIWATYFGKKFYVYVSEGVLFLLFIFACIGNGVYGDEYDWSDVTLSADVWFILIGILIILVLLLADSNIISFNQAPKQMNMNQPYGYNQPYNGYNQPQNNYMGQNPQMNNPYMYNNQMNAGYGVNPQMENPYATQEQMYNGYDPNNGAN